MMRIFSKLCVFVLLPFLVPGVFEIMENSAHLVTEGHLAHMTSSEDEHPPIDTEHGCTPLFHLCGCHAGLSFLAPATPPPTDLRIALLVRPSASGSLADFRPSIDRPPRA